jgi:uncharacterized cupredoxin-like copper-binding protein
MHGTVPRRLLAATAALSLALVGCTGGGTSPSPDGGGGATTVAVTLGEWSVAPESNSAPAGEVTFEVTNDGPDDIHEFVILKTDLDAAELPTDENGAVDEEGEGIEVVDEIEDIPVGQTQEVTATLEAGSYVLLCNIWDEDEGEAHYQMGMRTPFSVTD